VKQILQTDSLDNGNLQLFDENDDHHFMDEQDKTAEDYDRCMNKKSFIGRWMRYWFSPGRVIFVNTPARKLPSRLSLSSSDKILDVGCGYGSLLIYLHEKIDFRNRIEGIDVSPVMVELAKKELHKKGLENKIAIKIGRGTDLPYPDKTFDIVLSTYVVKHLCDDSLLLMLKEVLRVLKKGGYFCFWEAAPSRINALDKINRKLLSSEVSTVHLRSSEDLHKVMKKAGFSSLERFGHAPYLYYPVMPRAGFIAAKS
jgi:ubiquinone/menaquinone biosynthesis C-methylase UbiE